MKKSKQKPFLELLEELFKRTGIEQRTAFAAFLGVNYVTYCNWRAGHTVTRVVQFAVEGYSQLSDQALKKLVVERVGE